MKRLYLAILMAILTVSSLTGCGTATPANESPQPAVVEEATGTLELMANGEDFVRQGFTSKDGWQIHFDQLYITLSDLAAYQTDPPFDAATGDNPQGMKVGPAESFTIDLAVGDDQAEPILVSSLAEVPAGHYNALGWQMVPATEGEAEGYTILMKGTAQKADQTVEFAIKIADQYSYNCGEYVGEERKGILTPGDSVDLEATFHFDHVFGDAGAPADDALNVGAVGFDPLAALAENGTLDVDMADLEANLSAEEFAKLQSTLGTLGHVGEGHCYELQHGYTGHLDEPS